MISQYQVYVIWRPCHANRRRAGGEAMALEARLQKLEVYPCVCTCVHMCDYTHVCLAALPC